MSAHTPGPWSVVDDAGNGVVTLADVPVTDVVVAMLPRTHHANARLIAAAPDLLAALKAVGEFLEPQACADCACEGSNPACNMLNQIEQAIAEAEGQS